MHLMFTLMTKSLTGEHLVDFLDIDLEFITVAFV